MLWCLVPLVLACGETSGDSDSTNATGQDSGAAGEQNDAGQMKSSGGSGGSSVVDASAGGSAGMAGGGTGSSSSGGDGGTGGSGGTGGGSGGTGSNGGTTDSGPSQCEPLSTEPLVGRWRQIAELPCAGGPEQLPGIPIGELVFEWDGLMSVTWTPFETYYDYWGTYSFTQTGPQSGSVSIQIDDGNYIPPDFEGEGTFRRCGPDLYLYDLWLGTRPEEQRSPSCGYRFSL